MTRYFSTWHVRCTTLLPGALRTDLAFPNTPLYFKCATFKVQCLSATALVELVRSSVWVFPNLDDTFANMCRYFHEVLSQPLSS